MKSSSVMKNIVIFALIFVLTLGLAACGGSAAPETEKPASEAASGTESKSEEAAPAGSESESAAGSEDNGSAVEAEESPEETPEPTEEPEPEPVRIFYGAVGQDSFEAKVMRNAAEALLEQGVELEVLEFSEMPNLANCDIFQYYSEAAIDLFDEQRREALRQSHLTVGYTTCSPIHFYSEKYSSAEELPAGAMIAVSWAYMTGGVGAIRASKLLEAAGVVTLNDPSEMPDYSSYYLEHYIKENTLNLSFVPYDPREMTEEQLKEADAIITPETLDMNPLCEDPTVSDPYFWNRFVVSEETVGDPAKLDAVEKVVEAFQSQATLDLAEAEGSVIYPAGWDMDMIAQYR